MNQDSDIITFLKKDGLNVAESNNMTVIKLPKGCSVTFNPENYGNDIEIKFGKLERKTALYLSALAYIAIILASLISKIAVFLYVLLVFAIHWDISRYRKSEEVVTKIRDFYKQY